MEVVLDLKPDLILLHLRLPGKLGTEICKELREHCQIPIILFSAHTDELKFLNTFGANAFIRKPFYVKDLVNTGKLHLNQSPLNSVF